LHGFVKKSFVEMYDLLTEDDHSIVKMLMRRYADFAGDERYVPFIEQKIYAGMNKSAYCCVVADLVSSGDVVSFEISNQYDPWDRNLYQLLLEYFGQ